MPCRTEECPAGCFLWEICVIYYVLWGEYRRLA